MVSITLQNVSKIFPGNVVALDNVNLKIKDREFMVLVGPSGCGKSTCLNIIAGLEYITDGRIFYDDVEVTELPPKDRQVAMVFQSYALYPHMKCKDNMSFALKLARTDKEVIKERVDKAAKILGIEQLLERLPKELSGGQRQRVALGRCIVRNPAVFLFDEPLSNLDAKLRTQMRGEIIKLQKKLTTTLVYVTHDQVEAMSMADRITIMHKGIIQQVGTPDEVYNIPANLFVAGFIGSPPMNIIKSIYKPEKKSLVFEELTVPISDSISEKVAKASSDKVLLGIRPEHLTITPEQRPDAYKVVVTVIEYLGADTIVTFEFTDGLSAMAVTPGKYSGKSGDVAYVTIPLEKIQVFDSETEQNLLYKVTWD